MTSFAPRGRKRAGEMVFLNVYDLSPANQYLYQVGLGAFHSGVEVFGTEYSFGSGGGVFNTSPRVAPGATFRESIPLGEVHMSDRDVRAAVDALRPDFQGGDYNTLTKNCNSFSRALCERLLKKDLVPGWVNRAAYVGSMFSCLLPPSMTGQAPVDAAGGSGSGSGSGSSSGGGSAAPAAPAVKAFGGSGRSLGGGGGSTATATATATATSGSGGGASSGSDRRALMMAAAMRRASAAASEPST